jgi:hypothetical protein
MLRVAKPPGDVPVVDPGPAAPDPTMESTTDTPDVAYEVIYYRDGRVEIREAGTDEAWLRSSHSVEIET